MMHNHQCLAPSVPDHGYHVCSCECGALQVNTDHPNKWYNPITGRNEMVKRSTYKKPPLDFGHRAGKVAAISIIMFISLVLGVVAVTVV